MKITILSDIHGNLVALEKVFKQDSDSDLYIVIGDTVNYGPWSEDCVCTRVDPRRFGVHGCRHEHVRVAPHLFCQCRPPTGAPPPRVAPRRHVIFALEGAADDASTRRHRQAISAASYQRQQRK